MKAHQVRLRLRPIFVDISDFTSGGISFGAVPWLPSVRFGGQAISYDPRKLQETSNESLEERR